MMRLTLVVSFILALGSVAWLFVCYGYLVHDDYFHKYLLNARGLWGTVAYLADRWDGRVITIPYLLTLALLDLFSVSGKMLSLNVMAFTVQCVLIYWFFLRKCPYLTELGPLESVSLIWTVLFAGTIVYVAQIFNWYIILYYILVNIQVIVGAYLLERQRWRQLLLSSPLILLTFQHALIALMGMSIYWAVRALARKQHRQASYYLLVACISLLITVAMTFLTGSTIRLAETTPLHHDALAYNILALITTTLHNFALFIKFNAPLLVLLCIALSYAFLAGKHSLAKNLQNGVPWVVGAFFALLAFSPVQAVSPRTTYLSATLVAIGIMRVSLPVLVERARPLVFAGTIALCWGVIALVAHQFPRVRQVHAFIVQRDKCMEEGDSSTFVIIPWVPWEHVPHISSYYYHFGSDTNKGTNRMYREYFNLRAVVEVPEDSIAFWLEKYSDARLCPPQEYWFWRTKEI